MYLCLFWKEKNGDKEFLHELLYGHDHFWTVKYYKNSIVAAFSKSSLCHFKEAVYRRKRTLKVDISSLQIFFVFKGWLKFVNTIFSCGHYQG